MRNWRKRCSPECSHKRVVVTPNLSYKIEVTLRMYTGKGAWHFVTLPEEESEQISFFAGANKSAWGSVRVTAGIRETTWETSLFPDSKKGVYLLPVKAEIRRKEKIRDGDTPR